MTTSFEMIIFKDRITGDELFSDAFKVGYEEDKFIITLKAKMISRAGTSIDESAIGGNKSQEEQQEDMEGPGTENGIDVVLNHRLEDISHLLTNKKAVMSYLKKYIKNLAGKLDEEDKEKCKNFKANCSPDKGRLTSFMSKWTEETSIYIGEHMDLFAEEKACLMFGNWAEDGMSLTFYCLGDGILEEKQ